MKFGQKLEASLYPEWRFQYLDYDALKKEIKQRCAKGVFTDQDESDYVRLLENELDKIVSFRNLKLSELVGRIGRAETNLSGLQKSINNDDKRGEKLTERKIQLEGEMNDIAFQITELSKYVRLNYSGFLKILKKHDKHTPFALRPIFSVRLSANPFYKNGFDSLILRISKAYDLLRVDSNALAKDGGSQAPAASQQFVRKTTKYWVHADDVTELKCIVLKYLPVLVFATKAGQDFDPCISSVYFDNDSFELYMGRLEKTEAAQAIRFRWYGNIDNQEIFIERKTHREDWTGEKSVKERFPMKEKHVNEYVRGEYTMQKSIGKMRERGTKSDAELADLERLSSEIQATIKEKQLKPMIRTIYNRTAFQLPGDARVRISLDTDLCMVREDNSGRPRCGDNWRRTDVGTDYVFDKLPADDYVQFPYAVLEVKLQTQVGAEAPKWVEDLVQSPLVETVPKFSKFVHGVATLLEKNVSLLPFWLPQMDNDIRKARPPPGHTDSPLLKALHGPPVSSRSAPAQSLASPPTKPAFQPLEKTSNEGASFVSAPTSKVDLVIESFPDSSRPESRADEQIPGTKKKTAAKSAGSSGLFIMNLFKRQRGSPAETTPLLEDDDLLTTSCNGNVNGELHGSIADSLSSSSGLLTNDSGKTNSHPFWSSWGRLIAKISRQPGNGFSEMERDRQRLAHLAKMQNKRIALPVRVEPKVYFANERTFLQWLNFCMTLGGLALGLVNFGDTVGRVSGGIFTMIALGFMLYSTHLFRWRARMISERRAGPYDDRNGPTVLVAVLFIAFNVNVYLKLMAED